MSAVPVIVWFAEQGKSPFTSLVAVDAYVAGEGMLIAG
jgi:hypothetical protein